MDSAGMAEALETIRSGVESGRFLQVVTANPVMVFATRKDPALARVFSRAGLVVADSAGMVLLARLKGLPVKERVAGIDLAMELARLAAEKGWPIFLVGGKPGVAEEAAGRLQALHPGLAISGARNGYFSVDEEKDVLGEIRDKRPRIVLVGLTAGLQEKWIALHAEVFAGMCVLGLGGSLDVISGRLRRAPVWMRGMGLEWLFRLVQEPWRWRRALLLPVAFFAALLLPPTRDRFDNRADLS